MAWQPCFPGANCELALNWTIQRHTKSIGWNVLRLSPHEGSVGCDQKWRAGEGRWDSSRRDLVVESRDPILLCQERHRGVISLLRSFGIFSKRDVLQRCRAYGAPIVRLGFLSQRIPSISPRVAESARLPLYVSFHLSCSATAEREDGPPHPRPGERRRRGCDRSTLGPFESATQPDPLALLRPELEPLPERPRLGEASSYPQE